MTSPPESFAGLGHCSGVSRESSRYPKRTAETTLCATRNCHDVGFRRRMSTHTSTLWPLTRPEMRYSGMSGASESGRDWEAESESRVGRVITNNEDAHDKPVSRDGHRPAAAFPRPIAPARRKRTTNSQVPGRGVARRRVGLLLRR